MARRPRSHNRAAILAVLSVSLLIVSLDTTILNVALPTIARSMHASSSELQWIVDAYVIVFAGLLLVLGSLGDWLGRKWIFLGGLLLFAAGSATTAFSSTPDHLIASRAFMGIGGAAIMPSTLSLLTAVFPGEQERAQAIGIWSGTTGLGVALGPVIGGWLLAHYWWGSVFLVNVPVAVIGLALAAWLVPNSLDPSSRRPDPLGAVLSIAGMGTLLWGIIEAPQDGWTSVTVLGGLAGAVVLLTLFVLVERHSRHPMLQLAFFGSRRFSVAMGSMALVMFGLMGGLFLLTQYLQFFLGYSPLGSGLRIVPVAGALLVVAPLSSLVVRRLGTTVVVAVGMGLIAGGLAVLASTTVHGTYLDALPGFLMMGVGTGLAFPPCTDAVMGSLPPAQAGAGAATNGAALQVGGAIGVAVLGSLLNTRYQERLMPVLTEHHVPASTAALITSSLGAALEVAARVGGALGAGLTVVARQAFISGVDLACIAAAVVVGAAAVVAVILMPNRASGPESAPPEQPDGRAEMPATAPPARSPTHFSGVSRQWPTIRRGSQDGPRRPVPGPVRAP